MSMKVLVTGGTGVLGTSSRHSTSLPARRSWRGEAGPSSVRQRRARVTGTENRSAFAPLDAVLRDLTPQKVPGLSIAVVHRDEVVHEQAAGLAEIATNRPAGLDTIYLWFSMTKMVTATAAMQLIERGRLGLDDPVQEYLGEFPRLRGGWPQVTVRHLLSQSSRLGNPFGLVSPKSLRMSSIRPAASVSPLRDRRTSDSSRAVTTLLPLRSGRQWPRRASR
jgi:CubicO group peptidase (beta-lactamase class C family)